MDVTSLGTTTVPAATTATPAASLSDYSTFLRMLTVQMQNQDPLNPIESTDYAVQLATFSQVEQATRTNQLLTGLAQQFSLMGMSQLASSVGQEARSAAPVFFDGSPVTLSPNPAVTADRAVLVVRDANGAVVAREDMPVSTEAYQWLGGGATGDPLPSGRYSLSLESLRDGQVLGESAMEHYARVVEVRGGATGTRLVLAGGVEITTDQITALRVAP